MSMHKTHADNTELQNALKLHKLPHDEPSQLADAFRAGWLMASGRPAPALPSYELMKVVLQADEAFCKGLGVRGTTNWAAHVGAAAQKAVVEHACANPLMAVARVDGWANGSYWRNYQISYMSQLGIGDILYAKARS